MKKYAGLLAFLVIVGVVWIFLLGQEESIVVSAETTIEGDYVVEPGAHAMLEEGAVLTVTGDTTISGTIEGVNGVRIVALGSFSMEEGAQIIGSGDVQIVGSADELLRDEEAIARAFAEAGQETDDGFGIGPLVDVEEDAVADAAADTAADANTVPSLARRALSVLASISDAFIGTAHAQESSQPVRRAFFGGTIDLSAYAGPYGERQVEQAKPHIVRLSFTKGKTEIELKNTVIRSPHGLKGTDDIKKKCEAQAGDGGDAARLIVRGGKVTVSNVKLYLGNGGAGGKAESAVDCADASASGGKGGKAGNFKIRGAEGFDIIGLVEIFPGKGGDGGDAYAQGKEGGPGEKGGEAVAWGGRGSDNRVKFTDSGMVGAIGRDNVSAYTFVIKKIEAGRGGDAYAAGGAGGAGSTCGMDGGAGGDATATGGYGGRAQLTNSADVFRSPDDAMNGKGGNATGTSGKGGKGGDCGASEGAGGQGGAGGYAGLTRAEWSGGTAISTGGDGGDGGDGCPPGAGGNFGSGDKPGKSGVAGKERCQADTTQPGDGGDTGSPGTAPGTGPSPGTGPAPGAFAYGGAACGFDQVTLESAIGTGHVDVRFWPEPVPPNGVVAFAGGHPTYQAENVTLFPGSGESPQGMFVIVTFSEDDNVITMTGVDIRTGSQLCTGTFTQGAPGEGGGLRPAPAGPREDEDVPDLPSD